jgi:hypothetical protein
MKITLTATRAQDLERVINHAAALEERGVTDIEVIVDYRDETKRYLTMQDIIDRYDVGNAAAYDIMRSVHSYCGINLGKGKILPNDLLAWERKSLDAPALLERAKA